jgi:hypothetical protein
MSGARLAGAFAEAGATVEAICPRVNPAVRTRAVLRTHKYHALAPLRSFRRAIDAAQPDMIVPCDDLATQHLHDLYDREVSSSPGSGTIPALIERSLGEPASYRTVEARNDLIAAARSEGVLTPETAVIGNLADLRDWLGQNGFPCVLKSDGTWSGTGVKIARTLKDAERIFRMMNAPELALRVAKRAVVDRDLTLVAPFLLRKRPVVNAQAFVSGRDATSSIACWEGKVLGEMSFEVLHTWKPMGPASVVRLIDNRQMSEAAEKMAAKLNLSGFYGFDFKLMERTGDAYLIEMNPRAPQTSHLRVAPGVDLAASLLNALSGEPPLEMPNFIQQRLVALFPLEWQRNPASEFLRCAHHDVPWSEPELVRMCTKTRYRRRTKQISEIWSELWSFPRFSGAPLKLGRSGEKTHRTGQKTMVSANLADEFNSRQQEVLRK